MLFGPRLRWDLTMNCNLACRHCQVGDKISHRGNHPSLEEVLAVLDRLGPKVISQVGLLGGEPLSYPHIHLVLEMLMDKTLPVTISTNGLLIDERLIDLTRESVGWSIMVSIDGPDRETHEMIRGAGTFEPTMEKIRLLVKRLQGKGPTVGMACTLNALTIKRMGDMLRLARELEVNILQFGIIKNHGNAARCYDRLGVNQTILVSALLDWFKAGPPNPKGNGLTIIIDFWDNLIIDLVDHYLGISLPPTFSGCTAASATAALDCQGRLWPCPSLSYTSNPKILDYFAFGENSLARKSFEEIWQSTGFKKLRELNARRLHAQMAIPCSTCRHSSLCAPCPLPYILDESLDQVHCTDKINMIAESPKHLFKYQGYS